MNCYLSRNYKNTSLAGNKAKTDIERVMSDHGFRNVGIKQSTYSNAVIAFLITLLGVLKTLFSIHQDDRIVLQYPLKKYFSFVCNITHFKDAKIIVVIHDLGSFRRKKLSIQKEIERLNHADYIIAHNSRMKQWLIENGCKKPIGELGIFDFLSDNQADFERPVNKPYRVVYAGVLYQQKNAFLYKIGSHIKSFRFLLYGKGLDKEKVIKNEYFEYMGFVPADRLISNSIGEFGLVWDGDSLDACTGEFGEYLKYNNPHKTSLYIRCGLPIIIWKQAALASFIEKEQIGFCIESLTEIESILTDITEDQYRIMKHNIQLLNTRLSEGYFIMNALKDAINTINSERL